MLLKRRIWSWRNGLIRKQAMLIWAMILFILLFVGGCSSQSKNNSSNVTPSKQTDFEAAKKVAEAYGDIYEDAVKTNTVGSLEMVRKIVTRLGERGYVAFDYKNQLDTVNPKRIESFHDKVKKKKQGKLTMICVMYSGNFVRYQLETKEGKVHITEKTYGWQEGRIKEKYKESYDAYSWVYEDGYLFFEQYHMPGYDGPSGHRAVRVEPLDENLRELNRIYLLPIGYELNNMFTSNWSEKDYKNLNFYDLYEVMSLRKEGEEIDTRFLEEGITYEIPKRKFEAVFQEFFRVDSQSLQKRTIYNEATGTYQYRARGMYDFAPTPYIPYPEVVGYEKNQNGTIKLTVKAVWPEKNLAKAFCHQVVVRPLGNGKFQYVSNYVIPSKENAEVTWYTERLSDEKWKEYYQEMR